MVKFKLQSTEFHDTELEDVTLKIYWMNLYDDDGEKYGKLRIDITPYYAAIHPIINYITPSIMKRLEADVKECASPIVLDQYGFSEVYVLTRQNRLPPLISKDMEHLKDHIDSSGYNLWVWRA